VSGFLNQGQKMKQLILFFGPGIDDKIVSVSLPS